MKDFKSVWKIIRFHCRCLLKGFLRMMFGALTAGLFALAIYGFVMITSEAGWTAVCEFVAASATAGVGLMCMYAQGAGRKRGSR